MIGRLLMARLLDGRMRGLSHAMSPKFGLMIVFVLASTVGTKAQVALGVEVAGETLVVQEVRDGAYYAVKDGTLVRAGRQAQLNLIQLNEYLPFLVEVTDERASSPSKSRRGAAAAEKDFVSGEFQFHATLSSLYRLGNVFIVLDLSPEAGPRRLYAKEVGTLVPNQKKTVSVTVPLRERLGGGRYRFYVISDGAEVLTTKMPEHVRDSKLRRMVASRVAGVRNAEAKPLFGPDPTYPKGTKGSAGGDEVVLRFKVDIHGQPSSFAVVSTSQDALIPAAMATAAQWRFLPKVVDGRAIETTVEMPFVFGSSR